MDRRTRSPRRDAAPAISLDVVLLTCHQGSVWFLAEATGQPRRIALPWGTPGKGEHLDTAAARIAARAMGSSPDWMEQAGAFGDNTAHPGGAMLSVCFAGVVPWTDHPGWKNVRSLSGLAERQRRMVAAALSLLRSRLEQVPIAFSLLPRRFTLSELQQVYETILGRRLHKASFRRALQAAFLVEPTGEWRTEGRGRPAQLFRYAPRRRQGRRRGLRLDVL
jgi:8-oxo-dGTP diphosphatase